MKSKTLSNCSYSSLTKKLSINRNYNKYWINSISQTYKVNRVKWKDFVHVQLRPATIFGFTTNVKLLCNLRIEIKK